MREVLVDVIGFEPTLRLVAAVRDADDAIAAAAAELPDVAVVDVRMPGGGGIAAARGIKAVSPRTSVIAFSGHHEQSVAAELSSAGVAGYLVKGSPIATIVSTIREVAAGRPD